MTTENQAPEGAPFTGLLHEFDQLLQSAERAERYLASTPLPVASDVYSALSHACDQGRRVVAEAMAAPAPQASPTDSNIEADPDAPAVIAGLERLFTGATQSPAEGAATGDPGTSGDDGAHVFARVMEYQGKTRREVLNPHLTARECIALANYIHASDRAAKTNVQPKGTPTYSPRDDYEDGDSFAGMGETTQAPAPAPGTPALKRHALEAADRLAMYAAAPFFPDTEKRGVKRATTEEWWDGLAELIEEAQPLIKRGLHECTAPLADLQAPAVKDEPEPNDWRLPADLKADHVTFRKGVHCSVLVSRMKILHEAAFGVDSLTPEQKAENLAALQACKRPPHELAPPPPAATLTISIEGSTTTIDCDWGDVIRALPPGTYPLMLSQPPVQPLGAKEQP